MRYYYSDKAKNVHGPIDEMELARMASGGSLDRNTPVCREGANEWIPAKSVFPAMWPDLPSYQSAPQSNEVTVVLAENLDVLPSVPKATPILSNIARTTGYLCFVAALLCLIWAIVAEAQAARIQAAISLFVSMIYGFFMIGLAQLVEYIHLSTRYLESISRRLK